MHKKLKKQIHETSLKKYIQNLTPQCHMSSKKPESNMMYKYFRKIDTAYAKFPSMGLIKINKNYSYEKSDDTIH